jgi:enoyl-CoA hydratase/carnithine racemase
MAGLSVSAVEDGVVRVELDRPPENLFTVELCRELTALLTTPPEGAHVVRLSAVGETFCMGRERGGSGAGELRAEAQVLVEVMRAMRRTRLVTVAQVQGDAAGFGAGIVAASDVAVAVSGARFSFPEVGIGLAPAVVLAWLPRLVGRREAFWLTATGEPLAADRAKELGMLNGVVESVEQLRSDVDARVAALRARSPRVHSDIREMLRVFDSVGSEDALDASIDRLVVGSLRRGDG